MPIARNIAEMNLDGGIACLDFVNTALDVETAPPVDRLHTYADLLVLCERLKIIPPANIKKLHILERDNMPGALQVFEDAIGVRGLMKLIFNAVASRKFHQLDEQSVLYLHSHISKALAARTVTVNNKGISWGEPPISLNLPLQLMLISSYDLLSSDQQQFVKRCAGCEWLFVDTTRNHARKWCDMQACGSAAKSRTYYRKKRKSDRGS